MKVDGQHFRTIWLKPGDDRVVQLIDQRMLPHQFVVENVVTVAEMATALREMHVRGAGLIGAAAGYGIYLATLHHVDLAEAAALLLATRPTAINLAWAVQRQLRALAQAAPGDTIALARRIAEEIAEEDADHCR